MPRINIEQNIGSATPPGAEAQSTAESSRSERLQRFSRNALAVAGVALAVLGAETASTQAEQVLQPLPLSAGAGPFEVGVAAYSCWSENGYQMFGDMREMGMNVVRLNLTRESWQHDLSVIQHEVVSAKANGEEPVVLLQQAAGKPEPGWSKWAADMAVQLPGVQRFIIQNEPDSKAFWTGTMQQYANQLHQTYLAMHDARPDVIVSGVGLDSVKKNGPEGWLGRFMRYTTGKFGSPHNVMDTLSVHLYRSTTKDEAMITEDEGLWDGPINIDEFGRIVKNVRQGYNPSGAVTLTQQAKDYTQFIQWASNNVQVRSIENYHWLTPTDPNDLHTGLESPTGTKLPVYYAVKSTLEGLTVPVTDTTP